VCYNFILFLKWGVEPQYASSDSTIFYLLLKQQRLEKAIKKLYKQNPPNNFTKHNDGTPLLALWQDEEPPNCPFNLAV
jgi:hypothetical protein